MSVVERLHAQIAELEQRIREFQTLPKMRMLYTVEYNGNVRAYYTSDQRDVMAASQKKGFSRDERREVLSCDYILISEEHEL